MSHDKENKEKIWGGNRGRRCRNLKKITEASCWSKRNVTRNDIEEKENKKKSQKYDIQKKENTTKNVKKKLLKIKKTENSCKKKKKILKVWIKIIKTKRIISLH